MIRRAGTIAGLEQILLVVAATQEKPRRLYESLGFRKYGVEPRSLKVGGDYIDDELMILELRASVRLPIPEAYSTRRLLVDELMLL